MRFGSLYAKAPPKFYRSGGARTELGIFARHSDRLLCPFLAGQVLGLHPKMKIERSSALVKGKHLEVEWRMGTARQIVSALAYH